MDRALMQHAGGFKATYRVSLADSVALGLAQQHNAHLVSSDHHEFDPINRDGKVQFCQIKIWAVRSGIEASAGLMVCRKPPAKASTPEDYLNIYSC
jgi:hypothetical protein